MSDYEFDFMVEEEPVPQENTPVQTQVPLDPSKNYVDILQPSVDFTGNG